MFSCDDNERLKLDLRKLIMNAYRLDDTLRSSVGEVAAPAVLTVYMTVT
jgi:hypothetical protein